MHRRNKRHIIWNAVVKYTERSSAYKTGGSFRSHYNHHHLLRTENDAYGNITGILFKFYCNVYVRVVVSFVRSKTNREGSRRACRVLGVDGFEFGALVPAFGGDRGAPPAHGHFSAEQRFAGGRPQRRRSTEFATATTTTTDADTFVSSARRRRTTATSPRPRHGDFFPPSASDCVSASQCKLLYWFS